MFILLAILPALLTLLATALAVPLLVLAHIRAVEAPIEAEPTKGWALALDEQLNAHDELAIIDAAWPSLTPITRKRTAYRTKRAKRANRYMPHMPTIANWHTVRAAARRPHLTRRKRI